MKINVTFVASEYKLVSSIMLSSILDDNPIRRLYIKPTEWDR